MINGTFSLSELLWNEKFPWMVKVLHGTFNANKESLSVYPVDQHFSGKSG